MMSELRIRSSIASLEEFADSRIWADICQMFEMWLADIHESLEDPDDILPDKVLHKLRGNAQSVRRAIKAPRLLISYLEGEEVEDAD